MVIAPRESNNNSEWLLAEETAHFSIHICFNLLTHTQSFTLNTLKFVRNRFRLIGHTEWMLSLCEWSQLYSCIIITLF